MIGRWRIATVGACLIATLPVLGAPAAGVQTATASGTCGVAINASGNAVVHVTNDCDARTAAAVQKLIHSDGQQRKDIDTLQRTVAELTHAVQTVRMQAARPDASEAQRRAARLLEEGRPEAAVELLGKEADAALHEADQRASDAAAIYANQGALLRTYDVVRALKAYENALRVKPQSYQLHWNAGDLAVAV